MSEQYRHLTDDALFDEILRTRASGGAFNPALGVILERWKRPGLYVVRRIQASYRAGSPDDEHEVFQDAVRKLIERGLDQYHGVSEQVAGKAASPRTFFLRIVKHVAIDRYRRAREVLATAREGEEDELLPSMAELQQAQTQATRTAQKADARELYWTAFERLKVEHPNEAQAWDLYHHQDVEDHEECARQINITVANSYKRVSRAQAYMRVYLLEMAAEKPRR